MESKFVTGFTCLVVYGKFNVLFEVLKQPAPFYYMTKFK